MKIENKEVMILNVGDPKTNKNNEIYFMVKFATLDDGSVFDVMIKDTAIVNGLEAFQQAELNLELINGQYGLQLRILS